MAVDMSGATAHDPPQRFGTQSETGLISGHGQDRDVMHPAQGLDVPRKPRRQDGADDCWRNWSPGQAGTDRARCRRVPPTVASRTWRGRILQGSVRGGDQRFIRLRTFSRNEPRPSKFFQLQQKRAVAGYAATAEPTATRRAACALLGRRKGGARLQVGASRCDQIDDDPHQRRARPTWRERQDDALVNVADPLAQQTNDEDLGGLARSGRATEPGAGRADMPAGHKPMTPRPAM